MDLGVQWDLTQFWVKLQLSPIFNDPSHTSAPAQSKPGQPPHSCLEGPTTGSGAVQALQEGSGLGTSMCPLCRALASSGKGQPLYQAQGRNQTRSAEPWSESPALAKRPPNYRQQDNKNKRQNSIKDKGLKFHPQPVQFLQRLVNRQVLGRGLKEHRMMFSPTSGPNSSQEWQTE